MKSPILAMHENVLWTRSAGVWGIWQVTPESYGFAPTKKKHQIRKNHMQLLRKIKGEALFMGFQRVLDPAETVSRMIQDVTLQEQPVWVEEALANLDRLELLGAASRTYWIALPLDARAGSRGQLDQILTQITSWATPSRWVPSVEERQKQVAKAKSLQEQCLSRYMKVTPATVAHQLWIFNRALLRGLQEVPLPDHGSAEVISLGTLPPVWVDVAGVSELPKNASLREKVANKFIAFHHEDGQVSYQSCSVITQLPPGGLVFPGGELLGRLDELGVDVDWAVRLQTRLRDDVRLKLKRKRLNLVDQRNELSGTTDRSVDQGIERAIEELDEYSDLMDSDSMEVEVEHTIVLVASGASKDECLSGTMQLHDELNQMDIKASADFSAQFNLWQATLPGTPLSRTIKDYSHITTARNFSAFVPFTSPVVGQKSGILLGQEIGSGQGGPVLLDVSAASVKMSTSPAIGICGDLGGGKSYAAKHISLSTIKREDAQLITIDRTAMGEWVLAVQEENSKACVTISENAEFSIDPLRLFPNSSDGAVLCTTFLTMLLNISATDLHGVALGEILDPAFATKNGINSLARLVDYLTSGKCVFEGGKELGQKLKVFSTKKFTKALFDDTLPTFDQDARAIVFHASDFALPTNDQMSQEHLFRQLPIEKIFGRALYALLAGYTKVRAFRDRHRLTLFTVDEAHAITSSPEGVEYLKEFIRDGRKHQCALVIASHNPDPEFGDKELRGLIRARLVFRHSDRRLAGSALEWFYGSGDEAGVKVDPHLIDLVSENISPPDGEEVPLHRRGECLFRDYSGHVGLIKVLGPALTRLEKVISTTPGKKPKVGAQND